LLLRVALGGLAAACGTLYLSGVIERTPAVWVVAALLLAGGVALLIGFVTPFASSVVGFCVVGVLFSWFPAPPLALLGARLLALVIVITAVGIALLGPGAFSLDSYLFGRREIVIPPDPPES